MYKISCEQCGNRLEDCECEPGFPWGVVDPEQIYGSAARRKTGTVKWFSDSKGFGFIVADDSPAEVFVHQTQVDMEGYRTLTEGDRVTFEVVDNGKGPAAKEVRRRDNG